MFFAAVSVEVTGEGGCMEKGVEPAGWRAMGGFFPLLSV